MTDVELVRKAIEARTLAYTPYSNHKVGAALECLDGTIILGCNVENAAFSPTCCAERTAFFKAISEGRHDFVRIAIVGGIDSEKHLGLCAPCGVCRQVMREFCDPEKFEIILAEVDFEDASMELNQDTKGCSCYDGKNDMIIRPSTYLLKDLLPLSFGPEALM